MHETTTMRAKWTVMLSIVLPILITQIALYLMSFFDVLMSSKYSTADLAGVSIGSSIWLPVYTGLSGILLSITPIVAQLVGAKRQKEATFSVQQGFYVAIALAIIIFGLLMASINPLLNMMSLEPEVHRIAHDYLVAMCFGLVPLFIYSVLRCFIDALGKTRISMFVTLLATPVNIFFNYLLIFGKFGFPELGGVGSGVASAITYWIICAVGIVITMKAQPFEAFQLYANWPKLQLAKWLEICKIGVPIGLSIFAEISIFSVVTIMMSNYSTAVIGAHQIAMNFASLVYMIPLSISMGATILVGFEIGAKRWKDARIYSYLSVIIAVGFSFISATILIIFREQIAGVYSTDAQVVTLATQFLIYAAFFQLSDAIQAPVQGALRGYKDVTITFIMAIISYWVIGLPLGYVVANYTDLGPFGYWIGLISGLTAGAVTLSARLLIVQRKAQKHTQENPST
ncbi:MATE family efflux transporter [Viridibacillus sp. YIM B01967]|uniref:Probable multidrug resistance protein NorM n=1 Tax=Viridibacillus soli TaxID=2798301 RepID=A0ABS1HBP9_9BACL|nr:MATE family efflux transporter [Viridibacillus soli]MBK3496840.1 MATE family efflux transporter [Viridibacillus soli]